MKSQRMQTRRMQKGKNVNYKDYLQNIGNRNFQRNKDLAQQNTKGQVS